MNFIHNRYVGILSAALLLQAGTYYALASRPDATPSVRALADFPKVIGDWRTVREMPIEKEVAEVLKADDTLNREYASPAQRTAAMLFIAFFKTQRYGQAPHSPKNCLPGS